MIDKSIQGRTSCDMYRQKRIFVMQVCSKSLLAGVEQVKQPETELSISTFVEEALADATALVGQSNWNYHGGAVT